MDCSLVFVVGLIQHLRVLRDGRVLIVVYREGLSVRSNLSPLDKDSFLWTFPVFSPDRRVYTSIVFLMLLSSLSTVDVSFDYFEVIIWGFFTSRHFDNCFLSLIMSISSSHLMFLDTYLLTYFKPFVMCFFRSLNWFLSLLFFFV